MSKNLTRKGLALGALIALSSSLFAGAPALAANEVTLAPDSGTSYSMIQGQTFTLKASLGDTISSGAYSKLKFKVDNAGANAIATTFSQGGTANVNTDFSTTTKVVKAGTSGASSSSTGSIARLAITSTTTTVTHSVDVTAWLDSNDNDLVDDTYTSSKQTVTFVKVSEVTTSVTVTPVTENDTVVEVKYSFPNINNDQLGLQKTGVKLTKGDGSALATGANWTDAVIDGAATTSEVVRTWDTDGKYFTGKSGTLPTQSKGAVIKAQVVFEAANSGTDPVADTVTLGEAVYATAAARKVATVTATAVRSVTAGASASAGAGVQSANVKRNSTYELQVAATDADGAVVANVPVSVAIAFSGTLSATAGSVVSVAVNGTTYTDNAKLPGAGSGATAIAKISATTDAKGIAKVSVTTAGTAEDTYVTATFSVENFTAAVRAVAKDSTYSAYIVEDTNDNVQAGTYTLAITEGGTISAGVRIVDQFGAAPADEWDAQLLHVTAQTARATTAVTAGTGANKPVVGGSATVSLADNGKGVGNDYYDIYVAKRLSGGGYSTSISVERIQVNVTSAALVTPGAITVGASTGATAVEKNTAGVYIYKGEGSVTAPSTTHSLARNDDFGTYDARFVLGTDPGNTGIKTFGGTVTTAAGSTIAGAKLTIKAPGLLIQAQGNSKVSAVGELSVITNASGQYSVAVASNKSGKQVIELVSGSVTQKLEITFAASEADKGSALAITAPANVLPGQTLKITGQLTDKYGNPVKVATDNAANGTADFVVSYDGPGLVVGTLPTSTDADGKFTVSVLLGSLDTGSATLTAKYDRNGDNDYADATGLTPDVVKSATVVIGKAATSATAAVSGSTGKFFVSATAAAGKLVVVKVAGKFVTSFKATGSKKSVAVKSTKGSKKVTVYVGGKLVATKTVTVK